MALEGLGVNLCNHDPRLDPYLFVECDVGVLTGVYMGRRSLSGEVNDGRIFLTGDSKLIDNFQKWLPPSVCADPEHMLTIK